jgi:hypothetical protein
MKHLNPFFIVLCLFLFGCKQSDKQNNSRADEQSTETTNIKENPVEDELSEESKLDNISSIIALFKEEDIDKISDKISYPLNRENPIPPINNKEEFKERFNEVFDEILIDKIANSSKDQWSAVGAKGTMLDNGEIWIDDADGKIIAINYQSDFERRLKNDLTGKQKEGLHSSLKDFEKPTYKIKTKDYLIRIDELANHKYRYASWKIGATESSKPDLVLDNGEIEFQGSGGNHVISFVNKNYTYKIQLNVIGADDTPEVTLEVEKDGKKILTQEGTLEK